MKTFEEFINEHPELEELSPADQWYEYEQYLEILLLAMEDRDDEILW